MIKALTKASNKSILIKTQEDKKIFIDAILNPTEPNDVLKKAQLKYFKNNRKQA